MAVFSTAAVLVASATAACPTFMRWHGTKWRVSMLNNGQPRPVHGRLLGRTRVLDLQCISTSGWRGEPVSVYALPKIDPHVAFYQEGGHGPWAVLVRQGWKVKPGTPLWRVLHRPR